MINMNLSVNFQAITSNLSQNLFFYCCPVNVLMLHIFNFFIVDKPLYVIYQELEN